MGKVTIYPGDELHQWLEQLAAQERRSLTAQIVVLLEQAQTDAGLDVTKTASNARAAVRITASDAISGRTRMEPEPDNGGATGDKRPSGRVARTKMCPHRVPPDAFCKVCDGGEAA